MKNIGVVLAVGITAVIVIIIGFMNFFPVSESALPAEGESDAAPVAEVTSVDTAAVQAAFEAREALLQAQIAELDGEYAERQTTYDLRAEEIGALIVTAEGQLAQLGEQETVLQEQIEQLLLAQTERSATYEGQRQQAYYQYQVNIDQLQLQLDEANAKLSEALAQVGQ